MIYRKLGRTNLNVSVVGLGTYQFGGRWGKDFTQKEVDEIFDAAREGGINLVDTAACYGPRTSEKLVGKAINKDRSRWVLATKFGHRRISKQINEQHWDAEEVKKQLEDSLTYLKTDYIDIYQFHSGTNEVFDNDELWTMLSKAVEAGKIRFLGISLSRQKREYREYQVKKALSVGASVIQVLYNRIVPEAETEVLETCIKDNLGVLGRVPYASGLLSGKYKPGHRFSADDARYEKYTPEELDVLLSEAERINREEVPQGTLLREWSLTWPLRHPAVTAVLAGVKNPEHVRGNCSAVRGSLVSEDHPLHAGNYQSRSFF